MKILNTKFGRQAIAAALILSAMASMSLGAFAAEPSAETAADEAVVAGYLPPQDESTMTQGDIALHSSDAQTSAERDPNYGGYAAPVEDPIQGNVMMIDETGDAQTSESTIASNPAYSARYTVKGLLGKQVLYTARQEGRVLTLDAPDDNATFRTTILDMQTLMNQGVSTLVLKTGKTSTTLNLTLLCQDQKPGTRVTLRHLGSSAHLTVGFRSRRDLIVGR